MKTELIVFPGQVEFPPVFTERSELTVAVIKPLIRIKCICEDVNFKQSFINV